MFLSLDKPSRRQPGNAAAGPWLFLRKLEMALHADAPGGDIFGAVFGLFAEELGGAFGWAGYPGPDGQWTIWSRSAGLETAGPAQAQATHATAWQPHDPDGLIATSWAMGESGLFGTTGVIMLRGQKKLRGVLVLVTGAGPAAFPVNWSADMLNHFGMLIGHALEAREKQAAIQRGQILYRTLMRSADILLQARSERAVLGQLCAKLVESGLFVSIRIGQLNEKMKYRWLIVHGEPSRSRMRDLYRQAKQSAAPGGGEDEQGEQAETVSQVAWRTEKTAFTDDYTSDPRFRRWHAMAKIIGWRSIAAIPIFRGARRWAVLVVDANVTGVFDEDLRVLLERLTSLAGRALDELDRKQAAGEKQRAQRKHARRDALTDLPSRLALQEHLRSRLTQTRRRRGQLGVGMLDIDEFKQINERFGHAGGDNVLRAVGQRLKLALRDVDFVARLSGDEFALVLNDWSEANAEGFYLRMLETIGAPIDLPDGSVLTVSFSAGFTLFPSDDAEPDTLLRHADTALYAAKAARRNGKPAWKIYEVANEVPGGAARIRKLLNQNALVVHYQPVIDIQTGKIRAAEALARLNDGQKLLPPGAFLAEMTLQDRNQLFHQVLDAGLRRLRTWDAEGQPLSLSVNVDAQILLLEGTVPFIDDALTRHGIAPQRLILEILETHEFLDLEKAKAYLSAVRERGIRIALDDLGIGYSSILKLRDLPIDVVKLDRAFIAGLRQRPDDLAFISAFQMLTRTLGMVLVVEGVETEDIMDALRMMGEGLAQGYGIARPMPGEDFSAWMRAFRPMAANNVPATLLGAYAVHLNWVRVFQVERVRGEMLAFLRRHNPYSLDQFFANGPADLETAVAHRELQSLLRSETSDRAAIDAAASRFRDTLVMGLAAEA